MKLVTVSTLFRVKSGEYHAFKELDAGSIPLVSCGDTNNGVVGYYDIPKEFRHVNAVTVAYNGSWPIMSKFHPYEFGAKDDVAVLIPRYVMTSLEQIYIAALLNRMTWRYSYGRKCFREKLENVELPAKTSIVSGVVKIDSSAVLALYPKKISLVAREVAMDASLRMSLD